MTKTYKHRTLGWIYERLGDNYNPVVNQTHNWPMMPFSIIPELIENSSDRIELEAKDWISNCIDDIDEVIYDQISEHQKVDIRKILCKHIPQEKKFTRQEILRDTELNIGRTNIVIDFLKEHNLYSDTD